MRAKTYSIQVISFLCSQQENFRAVFGSISSVGSHAAMIYYTPTEETDRQITKDEIYLIDSGGQYLDGTTDVTRTVHFGTPSNAEREAYTRVLKGFIAVSSAVFPTGAHVSHINKDFFVKNIFQKFCCFKRCRFSTQWVNDFCGKLVGITVIEQVMELVHICHFMNFHHYLPLLICHLV